MPIGKTELTQKVAEVAGLNKAQAARAVDAVLDTISGELQSGGEVRLTGFGNFRVTSTAARTGRNPRTGEQIQIAAGRRPAFTPRSRLKQAVGGSGDGEQPESDVTKLGTIGRPELSLFREIRDLEIFQDDPVDFRPVAPPILDGLLAAAR